jgi:hypothetical protein
MLQHIYHVQGIKTGCWRGLGVCLRALFLFYKLDYEPQTNIFISNEDFVTARVTQDFEALRSDRERERERGTWRA